MTKALDYGQDKIQKICDILKKDTIEPAKKEAEDVKAQAEREAQEIIERAKEERKKILDSTQKEQEQLKRVFLTSLEQASKQVFELLRQKVQSDFFNLSIAKKVNPKMADPKVITRLIDAIIHSLESEGLAQNLTLLIPKTVSTQEVVELLAPDVLNYLKEENLKVGDFNGGVQVRLNDKELTLEMTDDVLKKLLLDYVRKDFRDFFFKE